ncbi:MAG: TolC family protein [Balneolaceae bacterium]
MKFKPILTFSKALLIFNLAIVFGFSSAINAQVPITDNEEPSIDLSQAINIALANNTQMKRALLTIHDADQQVRTAWSGVMPEVAANLNYTRNLEVPVNFLPEIIFNPAGDPNNLIPIAFGTDNNWMGGFSASQTLFNGRVFIGLSSASIYKIAQSENLRATAQGIVTATRVAYYQVLIAKEQQRLAQSQFDRITDNLKDTKKLFEQGFTDDYALMQLEVQLSNLEPLLTSADFAVQKTKRELLDILGLPLHLPFDVVGNLKTYNIFSQAADNPENASIKEVDLVTPLKLETDSSFVEYTFGLRGDLRVLDSHKKLQGKNLSAKISDYLPTIFASYNLNWTAAQAGTPNFFGNSNQRARSQVVSVGLSLPIFQGFTRDASIQMTKIQIKDIELQEYQTKQTATKEVIASQEAIKEVYQTSSARKKAVELAKKGYERALIRFKNGLSSQQEINDADLQLRQAEVNYSQMVFSYLISKAQYDQAIGQVPFVGQDVETIKENIELK